MCEGGVGAASEECRAWDTCQVRRDHGRRGQYPHAEFLMAASPSPTRLTKYNPAACCLLRHADLAPVSCIIIVKQQAEGLACASWLLLGGDLARSRGFFGGGSRSRSEGDRRRAAASAPRNVVTTRPSAVKTPRSSPYHARAHTRARTHTHTHRKTAPSSNSCYSPHHNYLSLDRNVAPCQISLKVTIKSWEKKLTSSRGRG